MGIFDVFFKKKQEASQSEVVDQPSVLDFDISNVVNADNLNQQVIKEPKDSPYVAKSKAKHKCKRKTKVKFVVGKHYVLHTKAKENSKPITREFECKKFIYTMKDIPMNIVIMKQVAGPEGKKFTLDKAACKDYHIKWEPGLEIFAMEMYWIPKKEN